MGTPDRYVAYSAYVKGSGESFDEFAAGVTKPDDKTRKSWTKTTATSVAAIDAPTDEPAGDGLGDPDDCFGPGGLDYGCGLGGPDDIGGFDGTVGPGVPLDDIVS